jgi:SulP family sulfate permease
MANYSLVDDIKGGVTAAVIALPLALAFGIASGLGAMAGVYGAIILGFFASLFGGTPTQISGPTGPMTVVAASTVTLFHGQVSLVMAAVLMAGVFQILLGLFRVGKFMKYIPYPVISGFMTGIGIIIIVLQLNPSMGLPAAHSILETLTAFFAHAHEANLAAVALTAATLAIMFLTPARLNRYIPTAILALVVVTAASSVLALDVPRLGHIPRQLPQLVIPRFSLSESKVILEMGIALAVLGMIDTLLTSLVADAMTKQKHNPNRELIGQGIGNSLCAFVGGLPGAGATMRTVINIKNGGRTRLSGMIHALTLALLVFAFAPWAEQIPLPVLAGILIKVGLDILDYPFLKIIHKMPVFDAVVAAVVLLLTVFVDLIYAVAIGTAIAALFTVYRLTREARVETQPAEDLLDEVDARCLLDHGIRVATVNGPYFFGTAALFSEQINRALETRQFVIDLRRVPFMDYSGVNALGEIIEELKQQGIEVTLLLTPRFLQKLQRLDNAHRLDAVQMLADRDAIKALMHQLKSRCQPSATPAASQPAQAPGNP